MGLTFRAAEAIITTHPQPPSPIYPNVVQVLVGGTDVLVIYTYDAHSFALMIDFANPANTPGTEVQVENPEARPRGAPGLNGEGAFVYQRGIGASAELLYRFGNHSDSLSPTVSVASNLPSPLLSGNSAFAIASDGSGAFAVAYTAINAFDSPAVFLTGI